MFFAVSVCCVSREIDGKGREGRVEGWEDGGVRGSEGKGGRRDGRGDGDGEGMRERREKEKQESRWRERGTGNEEEGEKVKMEIGKIKGGRRGKRNG